MILLWDVIRNVSNSIYGRTLFENIKKLIANSSLSEAFLKIH